MDDLHLGVHVHQDAVDQDDEPSTSGRLARSKSAPRERPKPPATRVLALPGRTAGRHVSLGPSWQDVEHTDVWEDADGAGGAPAPPPLVPPHFQGAGLATRVRCYCLGDHFDRAQLQDQILRRGAASVRAYPEVLSSTYTARDGGRGQSHFGDVLYFDWGSVVFWGLDKSAERHILREIAEPCLAAVLPSARQERESFRVLYTSSPRTYVEDDTLAIHYRHADDMDVKLAVSFALAQSTKLTVYEEELRGMGKRLAYVPAQLAESGNVPLPERQVMRALGQLYQQMQAVNLLGAALDVPDAMASAPSNIRVLYKGVYDYLEVQDRLQVLNDRFGVMREMLELCRTLGQQAKYALLESIILWLVGICVVVAVFQLVGFIGWRPAWRD